jgi:hypothetical protein
MVAMTMLATARRAASATEPDAASVATATENEL